MGEEQEIVIDVPDIADRMEELEATLERMDSNITGILDLIQQIIQHLEK